VYFISVIGYNSHDPKGKLYSFTIATGKEWHTHKGWINHDDLVGLPEGRWFQLQWIEVHRFQTTFSGFCSLMPRGATIALSQKMLQ
jgi:tRNA (adenine57-N1/adenine58-N1)-methyltransferase